MNERYYINKTQIECLDLDECYKRKIKKFYFLKEEAVAAFREKYTLLGGVRPKAVCIKLSENLFEFDVKLDSKRYSLVIKLPQGEKKTDVDFEEQRKGNELYYLNVDNYSINKDILKINLYGTIGLYIKEYFRDTIYLEYAKLFDLTNLTLTFKLNKDGKFKMVDYPTNDGYEVIENLIYDTELLNTEESVDKKYNYDGFERYCKKFLKDETSNSANESLLIEDILKKHKIKQHNSNNEQAEYYTREVSKYIKYKTIKKED